MYVEVVWKQQVISDASPHPHSIENVSDMYAIQAGGAQKSNTDVGCLSFGQARGTNNKTK